MIQCFIKYSWSTIFNLPYEYVYQPYIIMKLSYNTQVSSHLVQENWNTQAIYIWCSPIRYR